MTYALVEPPEDSFDPAAWDAWLAMVRRDHATASNFDELIAWGEEQRASAAAAEPDDQAADLLFPRTAI